MAEVKFKKIKEITKINLWPVQASTAYMRGWENV